MYLFKTIWPTDLYMYYPHAVSVPTWQVVTCAAVLAGVTFAALIVARRRAYPAVGWF
jgi:hypothetical protein